MPTLSIPLPRILAEGVAIVVSILLAFGIQAWWEGRQEQALEAEYLERLAEELRDGRDRLMEADHRFDQARRAAEQLISILASSDPLTLTDTPVVLEAAAMAAWTGADPNQVRYDATYEDLLATGNLGVIRNVSLRGALVDHFRQADVFVGVFEAIPDQYHVRFMSLTGYAPAAYVNGDRRFSSVDGRRVVLSLTESEGVVEELRQLHAVLEVVDGFFDQVLISLDDLIPLLDDGR